MTVVNKTENVLGYFFFKFIFNILFTMLYMYMNWSMIFLNEEKKTSMNIKLDAWQFRRIEYSSREM